MTFFNQPLNIGALNLKNRVFLAPLAGVSDVPFRRICQEMGAGLTYVEMLSATAIKYNSRRTFEMMSRHKNESVLGVQVTGPNAEDVAHAVNVLDKKGFDTIDINMGCPVRKVVSAGCGSGILQDPPRISDTVSQARSQTKKPLSAKFRLGYTRDNITVQDTSQRVCAAGADMLTIHGRTRSEGYNVPCDIGGIQLGIAVVDNMTTVGNGDIFDLSSAQKMQSQTGCQAVMVSRGALGNPWVFRDIILGGNQHPLVEEWFHVVCTHLQYQQEFYSHEKLGVTLMRKHLLWYSKGFPNSRTLREQIGHLENYGDTFSLLKKYVAGIPKSTPRFLNETKEFHQDPKYEMDRVLDRGVGDDGLL